MNIEMMKINTRGDMFLRIKDRSFCLKQKDYLVYNGRGCEPNCPSDDFVSLKAVTV